jgi:hypothetical protein
MATVLSTDAVRSRFRPSFFFWFAAVMTGFVFGGFVLAALQRQALGEPNQFPPVVHLHGVTFVAWMTLLMVQATLVGTGNVALHRRLGTFGIALGTMVLFVGTLIWFLSIMGSDFSGPFSRDLNYLALAALSGFGCLFTMAIRQARRPEFHRRLILFATIPLLPPGINRLYMVVYQLDYLPVVATYLTMSALALSIVVFDWRTLGKPSRASLIGASIVIGLQLLHWPVSRSDAFGRFLDFLSSLIYYR